MNDRGSTSEAIAYLCLQVTKEGQASYAHVHEIIAGLARRGIDVTLFEPAHLERYGAFVRLREFVATQRRLRTRSRDARAVYIRAHFASFPTAWWARRRSIPVVQEVNGPYEDLFIAWPATRRFAPLFVWLMRTQYRWADSLVTVTEELRVWLEDETGRDDVCVIPNGANTGLFTPEAETVRGLPERYVVFVGEMAAWQGIRVALEAVDEPTWPKGTHLVLVGDGASRELARQRASSDNRIHWLGRLPYRSIPGVLVGALAALAPMEDLGGRAATGLSPLKLYEALACGVPVVASDFPGQADLIRATGCGLVIAPGDPRALAEAVASLAANPSGAREMGLRGMREVRERHSWDARAAATADVVRQAIACAKDRR